MTDARINDIRARITCKRVPSRVIDARINDIRGRITRKRVPVRVTDGRINDIRARITRKRVPMNDIRGRITRKRVPVRVTGARLRGKGIGIDVFGVRFRVAAAVISTGVDAFVRHAMYLGAVLMFAGPPLLTSAPM